MYLTATSPCMKAADLKLAEDFTSRSQMQNNGWVFDTNNDQTAQFKNTCDYNGNTYYGFKYPGVGTVQATFVGSGIATLDYGNCHTAGNVNLYLNNVLKDVLDPNTPSKQITFNFSPSDVIKLSETGESIIKFNSLSLACKGSIFSKP